MKIKKTDEAVLQYIIVLILNIFHRIWLGVMLIADDPSPRHLIILLNFLLMSGSYYLPHRIPCYRFRRSFP